MANKPAPSAASKPKPKPTPVRFGVPVSGGAEREHRRWPEAW